MPEPTIHLGASTSQYEGRVDPDAVIAYALATNDPNPAYLEGHAVPPLFTVSLILPCYQEANRGSVDPGAIEGTTGTVHGEHDIYFHAPVKIGSALRWRATTYGAYQTPAGAMVTVRVLISDDSGSELVEHFWSTLHVGGQTQSLGGPPLPDHRYPESAREMPLGSERINVDVDQTFRYAGVSTDHTAMHIDDVAAHKFGYPSKFLQGLCTLAMCSGAVVRVAAGGDPLRLRRLAARFASPVFPLNEVAVGINDAGPSDQGGSLVAFEADSGGVTCIRHGLAEISGAT
jgi:acyl dehydratase